MLNKIVLDMSVCVALLSPLMIDNFIALNISRMVVVFMEIATLIAALAAFSMTMLRTRHKKKAFEEKELERCKNFWRFKVYEPISDFCIAMSLAAIGHYIIGAVYFMVGSYIRGFKYKELEEYEEEKNGSESN